MRNAILRNYLKCIFLPNLIAVEKKVRKVPKGYSRDVEINFDTSGNNEENKEVKVVIAAQVFNNTGRWHLSWH